MATPMDVDKSVDYHPKCSATPPCSNHGTTKAPPESSPPNHYSHDPNHCCNPGVEEVWRQEVWYLGSGSQLSSLEGSHPTWKGQTSGLGPWWGKGSDQWEGGSRLGQERV